MIRPSQQRGGRCLHSPALQHPPLSADRSAWMRSALHSSMRSRPTCRDPEATLRISSRRKRRGETGLFSTDLKNQLAAKVAGFAYLVRGHGFAELIACYFQGTDGP